jgi:hypothetical protein
VSRDDSSSDPPSRSAFSGLFPEAPTLEAIHKAQRKQAAQLVAILEANRNSVRRDQTNANALAKLELEVSQELEKLRTALNGIERSFSEFRLQLVKDSIPEAQAKAKSDVKLALLLTGAALFASGLVSLLFHFVGKVSIP